MHQATTVAVQRGWGTTADLGLLRRTKLDGDVPAQDGLGSKAVVKDENSLQRVSCPVSPLHVCASVCASVCVCMCVCGGRWGGGPRMREEGRASCHRKLSYPLTWPSKMAAVVLPTAQTQNRLHGH